MLKQKIEIPSIILHTKFLPHELIKNDLLQMFEKDVRKKYVVKNKSSSDNIKTDWPDSANMNRDWIKKYLPRLQEHFKDCANEMGFENFILMNMWYQQYELTGTHGWHVHFHNYTGVYYVEFDQEENPKTEFLYPQNQNKSFTIDVKEGDLIVFPSTIIHRSGINLSNKRKSIISFNLNFTKQLDILNNKFFSDIVKVY